MTMDGEHESRQILPRMASSDFDRVKVISSSPSHSTGYISGGVLGGAGLLALIILLIYLVRLYHKATHAPLITPMRPASPVSAYSSQTVVDPSRNHILHSPSPSTSTPSLTPQRMNSLESLRRFSTHKPPISSSPSITFTDLGTPQGTPLMAIPEMSLPSPPAQTYAGSGDVNSNRPARTTFLSRSSTRITSFLPRYQRSYAPSCPEDIPPAYHG